MKLAYEKPLVVTSDPINPTEQFNAGVRNAHYVEHKNEHGQVVVVATFRDREAAEWFVEFYNSPDDAKAIMKAIDSYGTDRYFDGCGRSTKSRENFDRMEGIVQRLFSIKEKR